MERIQRSDSISGKSLTSSGKSLTSSGKSLTSSGKSRIYHPVLLLLRICILGAESIW